MGDAIPPTQAEKWWLKPFSMLQTNLREIDADMSVDSVASYIRDHGADAWLIGIGGIQAQYPTSLAFHSRNSLLSSRASGDLISDALTAARAHNLRLLARMDFSKVSAEVAGASPEWLYKSPTGSLQTHDGGLVSVCPSGNYYQEKMLAILDEVITRYPVDGFFINWTSMNEIDYYKRYHGVCHCTPCQTRWALWSGGLTLPKGPDDANYTAWLRFSNEVIDDVTGKVRAFIADRRPSACLILGKSADIMFHEANNAVGRPLWHHTTSQTVSAWLSCRPDVPVLVNATTFLDMPYRLASEEPAHFAQYFIQCISRGGNPSTYMMGTPGRIPYLCLPAAAEITRFHKKWRSVYDGMKPCSTTGLVLPDRSQMTASQFENAESEYKGLYGALQELHIPFDVLAQERVFEAAGNGSLNRYSALILPDLGRLADDDASALDQWAHNGGTLVTTASSGVGDDKSIQLQAMPATREVDRVTDRELLFSTYFAPPQTNDDTHAYTGPIVPAYGTYHSFEWKDDSQGGYNMLARAPFSPPEKAYGNVQVEKRGYGVGNYGAGRGVMFPFGIGRGYRDLGLEAFRDLFSLVLRDQVTGAGEPISCTIAEQVEITLNKNGSKLVVHLVNMSGAKRQNFGPHIPISGGTISLLGGGFTKAHALVADQVLDVKDAEIVLPTIGLFEVVVIEP